MPGTPSPARAPRTSSARGCCATVDLLRGLGARACPQVVDGRRAPSSAASTGPARRPSGRSADLRTRSSPPCCATFPGAPLACATSHTATEGVPEEPQGPAGRAPFATGDLARDWTLWNRLRGLRHSKRGSPTPEGYDAAGGEGDRGGGRAAAPSRSAAGCLRPTSAPSSTARRRRWRPTRRAKTAAGLIDYADMIADTEAMLRTRPDILAAVVDEIDCVVIDEFQDTNPVQFALLWRLAQAAPRCLIVGDTKQSIMGFQGADPRLAEALAAALPDRGRSAGPQLALRSPHHGAGQCGRRGPVPRRLCPARPDARPNRPALAGSHRVAKGQEGQSVAPRACRGRPHRPPAGGRRRR